MRRHTSRFYRLPSVNQHALGLYNIERCDVMITGHRSMIRHTNLGHPDERAALGAGRQAVDERVVWDPHDQRERRREGRRCGGD